MHEHCLKRHHQLLLLVSCLLAPLTICKQCSLRGRFFGAKKIVQTRKDVPSICDELGGYQERAYCVDRDQFHYLHEQLLMQLEEQSTTKCF